MYCAWCHGQLGYVHGHAACLKNGCPMYGLNQAECCSGDTGCIATSTAASAHPQAGTAGSEHEESTDSEVERKGQ